MSAGQKLARYQKYEKDETPALQALTLQMNNLYCTMGGRDARPERVALRQCMRILQETIDTLRSQT